MHLLQIMHRYIKPDNMIWREEFTDSVLCGQAS